MVPLNSFLLSYVCTHACIPYWSCMLRVALAPSLCQSTLPYNERMMTHQHTRILKQELHTDMITDGTVPVCRRRCEPECSGRVKVDPRRRHSAASEPQQRLDFQSTPTSRGHCGEWAISATDCWSTLTCERVGGRPCSEDWCVPANTDQAQVRATPQSNLPLAIGVRWPQQVLSAAHHAGRAWSDCSCSVTPLHNKQSTLKLWRRTIRQCK